MTIFVKVFSKLADSSEVRRMTSKNLKNFSLSSVLLLVLATLAILSYQNCSNVKLGKETPVVSMSSTVSGQFCSNPDAAAESYVVTNFGVVNLNASIRNGTLVADSDMDGLSDIEELNMGFDPTNPRSMTMGSNKTYSADNPHLLDGFCRQSYSKCLTTFSTSKASSCGTPNRFGISGCEISAWTLTNGLDSDFDGVPDYVEFLRGTKPAEADMQYDIIGDGITNAFRIAIGADARFWSGNPPDSLKMLYDNQLLSKPIVGCANNQQSWNFSVYQVPMVATLATKIVDPISQQVSFLSHAANENVILIYYMTEPLNDKSLAKKRIYGQFVKIIPRQALPVGKFELLGEY